MNASDSFSNGWHENQVYPGTHWLYYNAKGYYRARVDLREGLYVWRVMTENIMLKDETGIAFSLEEAQQMAYSIMTKQPFQMALI